MWCLKQAEFFLLSSLFIHDSHDRLCWASVCNSKSWKFTRGGLALCLQELLCYHWSKSWSLSQANENTHKYFFRYFQKPDLLHIHKCMCIYVLVINWSIFNNCLLIYFCSVLCCKKKSIFSFKIRNYIQQFLCFFMLQSS